MKNLGKTIQEQRQRLGVRGDELAYRIGRAPSWLSRLENGGMRSLPDPDVLRGLAVELETSVPALLQAAGYLTAKEAAPQAFANPFPAGDPRHRLVELLKGIDLNGHEAAFWRGYVALQIRMLRDVEREGLETINDYTDIGASAYLSSLDELAQERG